MPSSREIDAQHQEQPQQPASQPAQSGGDAGQAEGESELARSEDRYKRALADLDNYRKRSSREVDRRVAEVRESVLLDWLDVVDSVERAMQMGPDGPCQEGLRAVLAQMDAVLQRQGAQRIGTPGEQFDPERHEAIAVRASTEAPDHTVLAVQRSGFSLGDRVIRPAQVLVARSPEHAR